MRRIGTGSTNALPTLSAPVGEFEFPFATKKWLRWTFNPPNEKMHAPDMDEVFFFFIYNQARRKNYNTHVLFFARGPDSTIRFFNVTKNVRHETNKNDDVPRMDLRQMVQSMKGLGGG
jgi:hypothetical protein